MDKFLSLDLTQRMRWLTRRRNGGGCYLYAGTDSEPHAQHIHMLGNHSYSCNCSKDQRRIVRKNLKRETTSN